jgi:hypothetical protein
VLRKLLRCTLLVALAPSLAAGQTATNTGIVIQLNVQPMPAPKPALRYLLLPDLKDLHPGNPIPGYLKCLAARDYSGKMSFGRETLREADRAARLDRPDWQILERAKADGINLLLPDLQSMRQLASALQERCHGEVSRGSFDEAIETAKTQFAMARHMGEHPSLIGQLVGFAIENMTIKPLEEMLEQSGCPNLYWALTNLPEPLVSCAKGMEGERVMISAELHDLDNRSAMSGARLKTLIAYIDRLRKEDKSVKPEDTVRAWLDARIKDPAALAAAHRRLNEYGLPEERLARFPADQVILLDENREFEVRRDELMKFMNLATWQTEELSEKLVPSKEKSLFDFLLPALPKVRRAQGRLEQRIALLRHVEAIRLFAAEHEGKLPEKLSDISVPLPVDPFTGKPFRYELKGTTARVRGTPPKGMETEPGFNVCYEITIRK